MYMVVDKHNLIEHEGNICLKKQQTCSLSWQPLFEDWVGHLANLVTNLYHRLRCGLVLAFDLSKHLNLN